MSRWLFVVAAPSRENQTSPSRSTKGPSAAPSDPIVCVLKVRKNPAYRTATTCAPENEATAVC